MIKDKTFWQLCKLTMLIQAICIITLVLVCLKIPYTKAQSNNAPLERFIDTHAHDKYQIVLYPNSKKQQMYFCYNYKIVGDKIAELSLYDMQENITEKFVLSNADIVICSTDVNFDDLDEGVINDVQ